MFEYSQTANRNPETGIRYGVTNTVPSWIWDEVMGWECPNWDEVKKEVAVEELKRLVAADEVDFTEMVEFFNYNAAEGMSAQELQKEATTLREMIARGDPDEMKDYTHRAVEEMLGEVTEDQIYQFMDENYDCELSDAMADIDDSEWTKFGEITNEQGTFKMMMTYLGGAPLLWVLEGPVITKARPCSICVPGAGDLDSPDEDGYECYGLPEGWFDEE
jgi:hypothetical protein